MSMLLCFYLPMHVLHSVQYLTIVNREDTWSFFCCKGTHDTDNFSSLLLCETEENGA